MGWEFDIEDKDLFDTIYGDVHEFFVEDETVTNVMRKYESRSQDGMKKYGMTMRDNPLNLMEWLNHLQEELMDATLYIERLMEEVKQTTGEANGEFESA